MLSWIRLHYYAAEDKKADITLRCHNVLKEKLSKIKSLEKVLTDIDLPNQCYPMLSKTEL